jgi:hypothetical protein
LEAKMVYAGQYKYHMDLFDFTFERKWALSGPFRKKAFEEALLMLYQPEKMLAGHIFVLVGPHVARGPDDAQA